MSLFLLALSARAGAGGAGARRARAASALALTLGAAVLLVGTAAGGRGGAAALTVRGVTAGLRRAARVRRRTVSDSLHGIATLSSGEFELQHLSRCESAKEGKNNEKKKVLH
eukprot:CAMPEP_0170751012 /NCGR_PEP_ID=MMETSP0437-20130122/11229_1 /TAXON_ID=0 /ORGANISM="Sexangularia sp." /LENGTH=111 /DNA_ID=CAMNT_0011090029 /DNA_START=13 /DNA_END=348 /DNA_ORIENTATION=+